MFGIVDDSDFESQLESLKKDSRVEPRAAKIVDINRGRGNTPEVPSELRKIIGEESIQGTPAKELSKLFGVSESSISAYKNDATSTASYHESDVDLKTHNTAVRNDIIDKSRTKLLQALETITPEKLTDIKPRDAAGIAKDMSAIIKNMEPDHADRGGQVNQQFIFYAPRTKQESDFEIIDARE